MPQKNTELAGMDGFIKKLVRLALAVPYFAVGSPYNIQTMYGVLFFEAFSSVWMIVNAFIFANHLKMCIQEHMKNNWK